MAAEFGAIGQSQNQFRRTWPAVFCSFYRERSRPNRDAGPAVRSVLFERDISLEKFMKPLVPAMASGAVIAAVFAIFAAQAQDQPKEHFRVEKPGNLAPSDAQSVYENAATDLALGYALSEYQAARDYRKWRRYNPYPYLSATHGNRYVNNFANGIAANYGILAPGEKMAPGAILAKDSFTVTGSSRVYAAALFIMEKLAEGRSPQTADWRYVMVLPDGSLFGDTLGETAEQMNFCHECHEAVADNDYLFFIPEDHR